MQDLRVTTVQANQVWEDKEANFKNYEALLQNAAESDLILLPEMFQTAFSMKSEHLAEPMHGESVEWLLRMAKEKNAAFYTSLIVVEEGKYYNRGVFVEPNGKINCYDKKHLFGLAGEDNHFTPGDKNVIVNYLGWKIKLQICYDLRFPEGCRNKIVDGYPEYDVLLFVANWPERRIAHWNALLMARAIENQCFVVSVNRTGEDATGLIYNGCSQVINALGEVISNHKISSESISSCSLVQKSLIETRERLPFLKDVIS